MAIEQLSGSGGSSWPDRKAHASLAAVENCVLEALKNQHPECVDSDGNSHSLVQLEYELADPMSAANSAQGF